MAGNVRARMVEGAARLLAQQGLQGTSFSEVLELTGAPRGSVYHHFPGGKDQLVSEALGFAGERAMALLAELDGAPAVDIAERFLSLWRAVLTATGFRAGCAVLAVTVATDSPELLTRAAEVFRAWRTQLTTLLEHGGLTADAAAQFAATLIAASEGAVVLARAEHSIAPFDLVAAHLLTSARERSLPAR